MCGPTSTAAATASTVILGQEDFGVRQARESPSKTQVTAQSRAVNESVHVSAVSPSSITTPFKSRSRTTVGGLRLFEFHGSLGMMSFVTSFFLWCAWDDAISRANVLHVFLVFLSVMASTTLSIHSSWKMLDQVPIQTVIWKSTKDSHDGVMSPFFFDHITAPHREAFHRTSLILQYVNSRILLELASAGNGETDRIYSAVAWSLVGYTCYGMIPSSWDWKNGNTFCFVLPMVSSVVGDVFMTCFCAVAVHNPSLTCWLSLRELVFVQISGLVIAFLFTLAFRSKQNNHGKVKLRTTRGWSIQIRPLYYVTAVSVFLMAMVGLIKAVLLVQNATEYNL
jgi:hypothetical protein